MLLWHLFLLCYHYEVIVVEYELDSLIINFNTSSTGMVWVPVKMVRSAANRQGNVGEFHSVWRVVTLPGWFQLWNIFQFQFRFSLFYSISVSFQFLQIFPFQFLVFFSFRFS